MEETFRQAFARYIRQRRLNGADIGRCLKKDRSTGSRLLDDLAMGKSPPWTNVLAVLYGSGAGAHIIRYMEGLYEAENGRATEQLAVVTAPV